MIESPSYNGFQSSLSDQNRITPTLPASGRALLENLVELGVVLAEDVDLLPVQDRDRLEMTKEGDGMLRELKNLNLLTDYQFSRLTMGLTHLLVLGNYRLLDRLGCGGMGVVFRGEHILMRRKVAIKVLHQGHDDNNILTKRFFTEMRTISKFQHPNIVAALDAGTFSKFGPGSGSAYYFVMEYLNGEDLADYAATKGLSVSKACEIIYQVASALDEAHKHELIHRDIKPSNIIITIEGQAKLLDFGLARSFPNARLTDPGTVLGTLDYMSPEQAVDSATVDIRSDIFGLGGTLYYCLTGDPPFAGKGSLTQQVMNRQTQPPPDIRRKRPDVPEELAKVVMRMMAIAPQDRFQTPQAVMRALIPFCKSMNRESQVLKDSGSHPGIYMPRQSDPETLSAHRIIIIDDEPGIREVCKRMFQAEGFFCLEAANGEEAIRILSTQPCDLALIDVDMPVMSGPETLAHLRASPPCPNFKAIMISGGMSPDEMSAFLMAGANDFITKPMSRVQVVARIKAALNHKESQDRSEVLNRQLITVNTELEKTLSARNSDLVNARNAIVFSLAKLVEHRTHETSGHLLRIQKYGVKLAEAAGLAHNMGGQITAGFIKMLECTAPLHDLGNVALPDQILLKLGRLDPDERIIMQTHTTIGAETLQKVARKHGSAVTFLQMAIDIARHHHENFDGTGYPDRLAGSNIPLAARIVKIGDVYDALRSRWIYRPALSHNAAMEMMNEGMAGQFDPMLMKTFQRIANRFEAIFKEVPDGRDY